MAADVTGGASETPGQRSASTVIDLIDGALGDYTSPDAMRWTPDAETHARQRTNLAFVRWYASERIAAQLTDPRAAIRITGCR